MVEDLGDLLLYFRNVLDVALRPAHFTFQHNLSVFFLPIFSFFFSFFSSGHAQ